MIMHPIENNNLLLEAVKQVVIEAKRTASLSNNSILLHMYWRIGKLIVEDEQQGEVKAGYGKGVLKNLATHLTMEFGKGLDERNLNNMRAFFIAFPIWNAVRTELSWTHYRIISRIEDQPLRVKYVQHTIDGGWSTRTLQRNIDSYYLNRILETPMQNEEKLDARSLIKDPYIFKFLGIPYSTSFNESNLETVLINHLQQFMMELGKGFAFVGRQQCITTDTTDYYIDLVFYNYYLKCFVLVDLKTGNLSPAAIGQMDMYVRMYNDLKKSADDNPTIGIILCSEKDETVVKYSVLAENQQLFASKYRLYLPSEEELKRLIDDDRVNLEKN